MSTGDFKIQDGKILLLRLGPMNGQVQTHRDKFVAPCRRGMWAFPYPFHEAFFYAHQWKKYIPKKFRLPKYPDRDEEDYEAKVNVYLDAKDAIDWDEYEIKLKEIKKRHQPKRFWYGGGFYSYIKPHVNEFDREWYWYESPRDYIAVAKKEIICDYKNKITYSNDHMQIFIPC